MVASRRLCNLARHSLRASRDEFMRHGLPQQEYSHCSTFMTGCCAVRDAR